MTATHQRFLPGTALLSAALVWLVSVTLCSTRVFAEAPHEHPASSGHSDHAADPATADAGHTHSDSSQHGKTDDESCGCESFSAFPAQTATLAKAPAPLASPLLYTIILDKFTYESAATKITAQDTGPPGRFSFAELVLQRCLLSHAPPVVA